MAAAAAALPAGDILWAGVFPAKASVRMEVVLCCADAGVPCWSCCVGLSPAGLWTLSLAGVVVWQSGTTLEAWARCQGECRPHPPQFTDTPTQQHAALLQRHVLAWCTPQQPSHRVNNTGSDPHPSALWCCCLPVSLLLLLLLPQSVLHSAGEPPEPPGSQAGCSSGRGHGNPRQSAGRHDWRGPGTPLPLGCHDQQVPGGLAAGRVLSAEGSR